VQIPGIDPEIPPALRIAYARRRGSSSPHPKAVVRTLHDGKGSVDRRPLCYEHEFTNLASAVTSWDVFRRGRECVHLEGAFPERAETSVREAHTAMSTTARDATCPSLDDSAGRQPNQPSRSLERIVRRYIGGFSDSRSWVCLVLTRFLPDERYWRPTLRTHHGRE